ncbi:hypothetical protein LTR99_010420 [Exophiala xenobiotica]|uniref:Uncharacterized protein n=1 Tax=Vermiconidia calcicola TaxID=1690605 RepID=A0AAV9PS16_9PEZI|nr:hypothetical protein LTR99_010420 [Exophiala xenobiotica]KAK5528576.1 hypothetical protein LTR25_010189 [Vermiconidia calcicola]KAK5546001.1 hypothetical protein LTR23_003808 [Chaetothyriales sp. CCFEE 6169]KAK5336289.1 hypothetical protein LTR98_007619 [Exophiala xenobiotica]KAK5427166.1 hypothetical protein LTR34_009175 [Exophiala xenobiotica]
MVRTGRHRSRHHFADICRTADGTSLIASPADNSIQTLIVPPDLLEEDKQPHSLSPYCTIPAKEPVNAIAAYPFFNLEDATTALVLSSLRDHPIRLNSALSGHLGASYPLVNPMTEAFISPHSLTFTPQGDRFIAGSDSLISVFDLSRPGQEPISSLSTGPKRKTTDYNPAVNMRGIVSALAMDNSTGVLAAGTYGRQVGLYNAMGQAECVGVFSVQGTAADTHIGGGGITQVTWSQDGRYLYITERKSDGVVIYDIRKTGQLLAWLEGRKAQSNQRLGIDLVTSDDQGGQEVWAGGLDGYVRVWRDPHQQEGSVSPAFEFKAHDDAISGVGIHNGGSVLATASGQRHFDAAIEGEQSVDGVVDNSLKIWTL